MTSICKIRRTKLNQVINIPQGHFIPKLMNDVREGYNFRKYKFYMQK